MINVEPDAVPDTRNASVVGGFPIPTFPVKVEVLDALMVVKAPVVGVVAPTVPLILMDAVPVRFVTTPDEGVPNAGVTSVGEFDKTTEPVPVEVVTPVPPFATASVPARVTSPVVAVFGVKPVVPALNDETPVVPEADSVPPDSERPDPTVISSAGPAPAVERPNRKPESIVILWEAFQSEGTTSPAATEAGSSAIADTF